MIRAQDLGKRYGRRWLFRHLDFDLQAGQTLVVVGSNGSGKSTLLKVLAGLLPPTEGRCTRGEDVRLDLGYAALDQSVYSSLTVREHLELAGELRGVPSRWQELLDEVELGYAAETMGAHLSTGMRARLKFALAVQANPKTILFDEPGAGLDEKGRAMVQRLIESRQPHAAIVIATNEPQERRFATHEVLLGE